ncbi:tRNA (adenosine(37)-N6)-threonylcarbamoyltransferase complex dimerization subunit type 1 TsaB [Candidatus Saccharibacteria bacterium]|nr:tRNA (adenosine(37)-N6)-threonylcarbamoyltransferase complex dimerization subunit type 1 TsaB [Candidatus Saccharibacteria bacterium]
MELYLDTSTFNAIIRLTNPKTGDSFEYQEDLGREMAEKLLGVLRDRLAEHGKTFHDLTKITFMSGPGSFTGLRIGATIVNTLAHELRIPLFNHHGKEQEIIIPEYGRPANISAPRK